jgi:hypothetical protein
MVYTALTGDPSGPLTIICPNWRNPIVPIVHEGYQIAIADVNGKLIEKTGLFSLDASAYEPFPLPAGYIEAIMTSPLVMSETDITFKFESPVDIETGTSTDENIVTTGPGCYLRITFPQEM